MSILKIGSKGEEVSSLQSLLNAAGYSIVTDGIYGKGTENAVRSVQAGAGLVVDGVAGPKTIYAIQNQGTSHVDHLTESDLISAAKSLSVELASIKAVNSVESKGVGFTKSGKLKILFERHKMFKYVSEKYGQDKALQLQSAYPDIVNKSAGGYLGGDAEYDRLQRAVVLDEDCAYKSASYGLYQIMGFNCSVCGYTSAKEMYGAMLTGEAAHLQAFVSFIKADRNLWTALIKKDWSAFARWYNGSDYAKNQYDTKLETAYKSFS